MSENHHHAEHLAEDEESYFVSMTDMMVGMLFVFIIMLMSFALNYREAERKKVETVTEITGADQARVQMLEKLQSLLEEAGVRVTIDRENGVLRLPEDILFPSASDKIKQEGQTALSVLARGLGDVLPCYAYVKENVKTVAGGESCKTNHRLEAVFIEGHTDNIPISAGTRFSDNWGLSTARAITTYKILTTTSPALTALVNKRAEPVLSVSGYGDNRPVADNTTEEGRSRNRRIDLRFLMATPRPKELDAIENKVNKDAP
jgi:flagellar motor protein MotB